MVTGRAFSTAPANTSKRAPAVVASSSLPMLKPLQKVFPLAVRRSTSTSGEAFTFSSCL